MKFVNGSIFHKLWSLLEVCGTRHCLSQIIVVVMKDWHLLNSRESRINLIYLRPVKMLIWIRLKDYTLNTDTYTYAHNSFVISLLVRDKNWN